MANVSGKVFDREVLRGVLTFVKPFQKTFYSAAVLTVLLGFISTARPLLIRDAVDTSLLSASTADLHTAIAWLMGLLLVEGLMQWLFYVQTNRLGQWVIREIRVQLFGHLLRFTIPFFDKTPVGTLVTRTVSDVETIADIFSEGLLVIFGDFFKILVMLVAMFVYFDPALVAISLSVLPVLFLATRWFQRSIKDSFTEVRNQVAALNAFVQERITGMAVVRLFQREEVEAKKFKEINARHREANIRSIWYFSLFLPIIEMLSAISIGLAVWFGGYRVATGSENVSLGDLTAMILFINMLYRPLRQLADRFNTLQMGMVASERVLKLLNNAKDVEATGKHITPRLLGRIVIDRLSFSYLPEEPVLQEITLSIEPGETLAIVGPTGSGKSTLISLLMGHYAPTSGTLSIDGVRVEDWNKDHLRQQMALVMQDVFLFSDTVANNLTLFEPIEEKKLWEAAKEIGIEEFIEQLPGGLHYNVRERGGMLSTGQRQLLAFLRAYLLNPPVLILDEATSSIDAHSEVLIQRATEVLTKGRTSVVVAHRLATVAKADRIAVLDKGVLVEVGTHKELLARNGMYAQLHAKQFIDVR